MNNNTTITKIIQDVIKEKAVEKITREQGYKDVARKARVSEIYRYQMVGAIEKSESYRELEISGGKHSRVKLDHSTLSKKGKEIPYEIALKLLEETMKESNREKRRQLTKEYNRFVRCFDTTRLTDISNRYKWDWTPYDADKNGIKVHVSYQPETELPDKFEIGKIHVGDTAHLDDFCPKGDDFSVVLADRGYLSVFKFCHLDDAGQDFVIRIPERVNLVNPVPHDFKFDAKYSDILCSLGKDHSIPAKYRKRQFRVISFVGDKGKNVTLCTNIYSLTADEIAALYRMRWSIEVFFKTLKQNFSLKKIFGSTINAVFTQVIINFLTYIVLFHAFSSANFNFSFLTFLRYIRYDSIDFSLQLFLLVYKI